MKTKKLIIPFLLISSLAFGEVKVESVKKVKTGKDFTYNLTIPQFKFNGKEMKDLNGAFTNDVLTTIERTKVVGQEVTKMDSDLKAEAFMDFDEYKNSFGVTSVVLSDYMYEGGAHGMTVLSSYNIDNTTGKILTFDDVFIKSAKQSFEKGILQIIKNNKDGKYMSDIESVDLNSAVMYFDGDYVVFKFQQYSIAPYSSGEPAFRYNKEDIKSFFKYKFN